jgi:hypothetical protein
MRHLVAVVLWLAMSAAIADTRTVNGVEIRPGAKIDVVFFTADDCSYCNRWKKSSRDDFLKWAEKSKVAYREVNKRRVAEPYAAAHFPPEAAYAWNQVQASGKVKFMIPRWIVYADQQRVIEGAGLNDWNRVYRLVGDVTTARDQPGK